VAALRETLEREGGMVADEHGDTEPVVIVDPQEVGFAAKAAALLRRDGYVVVRDVLDADRLAVARAGVEKVVREMVARDPDRLGNRGSHRYTFGSAAEAFGEQGAWSVLVDPPALLEIMAEVFKGEEFQCGDIGGGDFCLPGALAFQRKHAHTSDPQCLIL
jgi:hypothetical protein